MTRLFAALIRHGDYQQRPDTPSAHQPYSLNEDGIKQSNQAADLLDKYIKDNSLELSPVIDSSHLLRAWQTAQIMSDRFTKLNPPNQSNNSNLKNSQLKNNKLKVESFVALAERGVGSCVANLTLSQIEAVIEQDPRLVSPPANWKSNSQYCLPFPDAESLMIAGERVARHITEQMEQLRANSTKDSLKIFVGHGAAFRHAAYHFGVLDFKMIARLSMYHASPIYLEYFPDKYWQHSAGEWKVRGESEMSMD